MLYASRKYTIFIVIILILNIILFGQGVAFSQEEIKIPILTYHYFYTNPYEVKRYNLKGTISIDSFEKQMEYLHKNDYHTLSLNELYEFLIGKYIPPKKSIVITMDDGYENNYSLAYPILKKYHFTAAIFIIGKMILQYNGHFPFQYLSLDNMQKSADVFEFGSHTFDMHRYMNGKPALLSADMVDILFDLLKNKLIVNTPYFAYPFGAYNQNIIDILKAMNYKLAFTVKKGYVTRHSNPYELPRFSISDKTSFEKFVNIVEGKMSPINISPSNPIN